MVTNTFPVSEAKPLIKIPKDIPQIGYFGGEHGWEIDASIKTDYKGFSVMQVGNYSDMPVVIPLYGLELVKDQGSPHRLAFKLNEDAEITYAPILSKSSDSSFNSEDIDVKTGLPTKISKGGNRTLLIRDSGLSRLYLNRNLNLNSNNDNLTNSNDNGRVVFLK